MAETIKDDASKPADPAAEELLAVWASNEIDNMLADPGRQSSTDIPPLDSIPDAMIDSIAVADVLTASAPIEAAPAPAAPAEPDAAQVAPPEPAVAETLPAETLAEETPVEPASVEADPAEESPVPDESIDAAETEELLSENLGETLSESAAIDIEAAELAEVEAAQADASEPFESMAETLAEPEPIIEPAIETAAKPAIEQAEEPAAAIHSAAVEAMETAFGSGASPGAPEERADEAPRPRDAEMEEIFPQAQALESDPEVVKVFENPPLDPEHLAATEEPETPLPHSGPSEMSEVARVIAEAAGERINDAAEPAAPAAAPHTPAHAVEPPAASEVEPPAASDAEPVAQANTQPENAEEISLDELDALLAKRAEKAKAKRTEPTPVAATIPPEEIKAEVALEEAQEAAQEGHERVGFVSDDPAATKAAEFGETHTSAAEETAKPHAEVPGVGAIRWLLNVLDWPFRGVPVPVKKLLGIAAIVLLIPAITLLILCLFFAPSPMR